MRTVSTELVLTYLSELDNNQLENLKNALIIAFSKSLSGVEVKDIEVVIVLISQQRRRYLQVDYKYKSVLTVKNPPDSKNVLEELSVLTSSIKDQGTESEIVQTINQEATNLGLTAEVASIGVIKDPVDEIVTISQAPTKGPTFLFISTGLIGRDLGTGISISFILVFVFGFVKGTY